MQTGKVWLHNSEELYFSYSSNVKLVVISTAMYLKSFMLSFFFWNEKNMVLLPLFYINTMSIHSAHLTYCNITSKYISGFRQRDLPWSSLSTVQRETKSHLLRGDAKWRRQLNYRTDGVLLLFWKRSEKNPWYMKILGHTKTNRLPDWKRNCSPLFGCSVTQASIHHVLTLHDCFCSSFDRANTIHTVLFLCCFHAQPSYICLSILLMVFLQI